VTSILGEKGILETELSSAMTPLCIVIKNDPVFFKTGNMAAGNPMELTCQLAVKCFQLANDNVDEVHAMCSIGLMNAVLENVPEC